MLILPLVATVLLIVSAPSPAQPMNLDGMTPAEQGYAIMERSDQSDAGFRTSSVRLTMTLADSRGRETVRDLQIDTLERQGEGNGDRSLTQFFSPPDVEGTALLSHARVLDPDNQWLYLPALRRVKRISSAHKSG
ncbi:MAG: outer membrane lipoprotein-sorting protein, partial [Planctomycetota bacterium]